MTKLYWTAFFFLILSACSKDNTTTKSSNIAASITDIKGTIDDWVNSSENLYLTISSVDSDYFNNIISQSKISQNGSFSVSLDEINTSNSETIDQISWWYDTKDLNFSNNKVKSIAFTYFDISDIDSNKVVGSIFNSNYPDSLNQKLNYEFPWYIYVSSDITLSGKERDTFKYENGNKFIEEYTYNNIKLKKGWNILYYSLEKNEGFLYSFTTLIKPKADFHWRATFYYYSKKAAVKNKYNGKTKR
jgi:hypothetical protein